MDIYFQRLTASQISSVLERGKSVLLLGPRQTGKTTMMQHQIQADLYFTFAEAKIKQRYERNPALLESELEEKIKSFSKKPLVFIDEVQKIPLIMDIVQNLIDKSKAQFILTGSSARKLKHGPDINLLPGRVVALSMTSLLYPEYEAQNPKLEEILLYGTLPGIMTQTDLNHKEIDLYSYVSIYLEEEIRAEALVRNVGMFSRFLELAASESGKQLNFTRLSQDIGVSDTTIASYYQILEDCLIVRRIDPIIHTQTKRRLIKSPKYLFFDLGVRRAAANEGTKLPQRVLGDLFEQFVGNELISLSQLASPHIKVKYWKDSAGAEIDYVLDIAHEYIPIEVKWSEMPKNTDAKHLVKFLDEYPEAQEAYIICRTPHRYRLGKKIMVIPWQEIRTLFNKFS